jgi:hypothetical protein
MKLTEALASVRFHYSNFKHDPKPLVKVLDTEYPGQKGQSTYGQRKDLLGWNENYFLNKKEAVRSIDEIDSFARLMAADNREKYERVKIFFPEQAQYLRRYIKDHIVGLRVKEDGLWKKTTFDEVDKLNKEFF